jgi:hypothetical protein
LTFGRRCIGGPNQNFSCPAGQFLNTDNICIDASNCTNFYVVSQKRCWYDAPVGTTPFRENNTNYLTAPSVKGSGDYLKIDVAAYLLNNGKYLVFIVPYKKFAQVSAVAANYPNWYFKNAAGQTLVTTTINGTNNTYDEFLLINTTFQSNIISKTSL